MPRIPIRPAIATNGRINHISPGLRHLVVPISGLIPDPANARVHSPKNIDAIKLSLQTYGQLKTIVVRKQNMVVAAGNGTLEAAKQLGWTEIAANIVEMTDAEFAGFSVADNRTAELATWDFAALKALDRVVQAAGHGPPIGWEASEIESIRDTEWVPPEIHAATKQKSEAGKTSVTIHLSEESRALIAQVSETVRQMENPLMSDGECLLYALSSWIATISSGEN